jgi:hypothetical protein
MVLQNVGILPYYYSVATCKTMIQIIYHWFNRIVISSGTLIKDMIGSTGAILNSSDINS